MSLAKKIEKTMSGRRQRGVSLIEIMVAVTIGLLAIYAIYIVYGNSEKTKRNIVSIGEAQISGLYSVFLMNRKLSSSGGGVLTNAAAALLRNCPAGDGVDGDAATLLPVPVAIDDDGDDGSGGGRSNSKVFVTYSTSSLYPLPLAANFDGTDLVINAPLGFRPNSVLYVIGDGGCQAVQVAGVTMGTPELGQATVALGGVDLSGIGDVRQVVDMGSLERSIISLRGDVLQIQRWVLVAGSSVFQTDPEGSDPVASNVMGFYAQYGLDTVGAGAVTQWQDVSTDSSWASGGVVTKTPAQIGQIKAIRYGLIVRADEPERDYDRSETVRLFCPSVPPAACPAGAIVRTFNNPDSKGLGWRYRAYETVVPIRNSIWSPNSNLM
ncbi:MAG: PilW family protein [Burkholderiales bacterium]|nr:PilW family protein [Burkholderiales bacterium]